MHVAVRVCVNKTVAGLGGTYLVALIDGAAVLLAEPWMYIYIGDIHRYILLVMCERDSLNWDLGGYRLLV